ncbi:hypothetical protein PV10_04149 [Exophiala mesophila]|uniref:Uncharacterized protein n=1 Tax=Exophiala mesophila TaxID=212818 RepID=A0A0D2A1G4_EXOME|nr:uncharacterized protein PV10_04149 [Exophiala mesophila]KIV92888.1 hypothetical protein PV10_04149 [Exophiala mesophila]
MAGSLIARQYYQTCYNSYGQPYRCRTAWNSWGRWAALGVILAGALLLFFLCACFSSRRRRKHGRQPYYGTGWAGRTPWGHGQAQYNPNYQQTQQPQQGYQNPPTYNQTQSTGGYYGPGANTGNNNTGGGEAMNYYQGRGGDVEMQTPNNTYGGSGPGGFEPPPGPPPSKIA